MEVERKRAKGGFLQLFDWNGKSRKKLFSNNSELLESKRVKPEEFLVKPPPHTVKNFIEEDEYSSVSNNRRSDFNSSSSVTSDDGYGSRAPGVVARLMGLDSLPTLNVSEPSSIPYSGSCSLRVSHYESTPNLWNEYQPTDYTNISNKFDRSSSNPIEPRFHKAQNRPIERFQTEILPPKPAKPIPVTHHKLLSPIRSPAFIPTKNVAYIMEAAAKIIEASPRATSNGKVPSFGSSSAPLKMRNLREKIEAAHKASRSRRADESSESMVKPLKVQQKDKNHGKSDYRQTVRITKDSEKGISNNSRNKGKSISLVEQARANNVQRKEGSSSSVSGSFVNQKERNDAKRKQFSISQSDVQRTVEKRTSANRANNVLRQNNQKQNCTSNRDYSTSKISTLDQQGRNAWSIQRTVEKRTSANRANNVLRQNNQKQNCTSNRDYTTSKISTLDQQGRNAWSINGTIGLAINFRKTVSVATDTSKEVSISRRKNLPRKKHPVNEDLPSRQTVADISSPSAGERSIKCNVTTDGHLNLDADIKETNMDVVSFTFTSPLSKSMLAEKSSSSFNTDPSCDNDLLFLKSSAFSSPGFNIIGGDALSVILEKKLQELTCRTNSSNCNIIIEGTSASLTSSLQNSVPPSGTAITTSVAHHKRLHVDLDNDISCSSGDFDHSSDNLAHDWRMKWQQSEEMEEQNAGCNSSSETSIDIDNRYPSPLSTLEPAVTSGGCSGSRKGTKPVLSVQDQEFSNWTSESESLTEFGMELSDSASSIPTGETDRKLLTTASYSYRESINWEIDFVKTVLKDSELLVIEYALGQTEKVMTLKTFNQLEHRNGTERNGEDYNLEQKLLLDCVSECVESRYQEVLVGSCKGWVRWGKLIQKRGWLAEEVNKDILGWKSIGDTMVDDLVYKDMSTKHGRWLDFDMEAFEEGVEIQKNILTSLVDELVYDLLL